MNRFVAPMLALVALTIVPAADAAPRVTSAVTLAAPTLTVKLAPGSKFKSVKGGTARKAGRLVTITARGRALTVVTTGAAPKAWAAGGQPCAVKRAGTKTRLVVTCPAGLTGTGGQSGAGGNNGLTGAGGNGGQSGGDGNGGQTGTGGNGGQTGPGPNTGGPNDPGAVAPAAYKYAPYVDFAGWPAPDLALTRSESGAKHISLGFVTQANTGAACTPAWGGFDTYPASGPDPYQLKPVQAFKGAGGDVVPSFGGASGTELAHTCKDEYALAKAYSDVIKAYGVTHVDFDIEGAALKDEDLNVRRNKAIAIVQQQNPGLVVTFTLPALITGMDVRGGKLVANAIANGVAIAAVNLMAMNLNVANPAGMGAHAITVGEALHNQLATLYPSLNDAQRWAKVGLTPMVGINDDPAQNFTPQDATTLLTWAQGKQIGMLGLWSLRRDELSAVKYQYSKGFVAFD